MGSQLLIYRASLECDVDIIGTGLVGNVKAERCRMRAKFRDQLLHTLAVMLLTAPDKIVHVGIPVLNYQLHSALFRLVKHRVGTRPVVLVAVGDHNCKT